MQLTYLVIILIASLVSGCGERPPHSALPEATRPSRIGPPRRPRPGPVATFGVKKVPEEIRSRLRRYLGARESRFYGWETRGGGMLVGGRFGDTRQVFRVSQPGGARKQLTFAKEQICRASWVPGSYDSSLVTVSRGAADATRLERLDLLEDKRQQLVDKTDAHVGRLCWSRSGKLAFSSTARNGRDQDIYVGDGASAETQKLVYQAQGQFEPLVFSADEKKLLLKKINSRDSSALHVLDLESGQTTQVTEASDADVESDDASAVAYGTGRFTKNGRGLYLTSDRNSKFLQLYYYDLSKQTFTPLVDSIAGDVEELVLSTDGRTLAFSTNEGGYSSLYLIPARTRRSRTRRVDVPKGILSDLQFSRDRKRPFLLGFTLSQPTSPADAFSYNTRTRKVVRWTTSEVGGLNSDFFVEPRPVQIQSLDGVDGQKHTIPAFYYKPPGQGPHPVLVHLHPQATGQFRPGFNPWFQYLLMEKGVAIIAPNLRGSNGQGKTFRRLDDGPGRVDVLKDVAALLDWIKAESQLDARRVVLHGESYGAALLLNALAAYPKRIKGGIAQAAIFDFPTLIKHLPPRLHPRFQAELGDIEQKKVSAALKELSPLDNLDKIKQPLLIIHGALDHLSPRKQADRVVKTLHSEKRQVGYLVAYREGHRFQAGAGLTAARTLATHFVVLHTAK